MPGKPPRQEELRVLPGIADPDHRVEGEGSSATRYFRRDRGQPLDGDQHQDERAPRFGGMRMRTKAFSVSGQVIQPSEGQRAIHRAAAV